VTVLAEDLFQLLRDEQASLQDASCTPRMDLGSYSNVLFSRSATKTETDMYAHDNFFDFDGLTGAFCTVFPGQLFQGVKNIFPADKLAENRMFAV
jgi:hypothetical protein